MRYRDGTDITGVSFPVKVLTPWALKNAKQVTDADSYDITVTLKGKESTTTYTGADALFENESYAYYKLSETPAYYITAWYNLLSGKWEFGKVHATETTVPSQGAVTFSASRFSIAASSSSFAFT